MSNGWKQFGAIAKREGLAFLWTLVYDPFTARVVRFFRHPKRWRRRLLTTAIVTSAIVVMVFLVLPNISGAQNINGNPIANVFGFVLALINQVLAWILIGLGAVFNGVVYKWDWFQKIVTQPAVNGGWVAVRNITNLSFVLILLGIGFATILRVPTYHVKRLIVPFVIALLLINFSKLICGVILDFCRILMASFVNSIDVAGGNYSGAIASAVGVEDWWNPTTFANEEGGGGATYFQAMLAAFVFMIAMVFAFLMLIVLLVARWVSLMVLTIFSPLAYAGMILPSTKGMVSKWWRQFLEKAFYGPAAVFMVWLAIYVLSSISELGTNKGDPTSAVEGGWRNSATIAALIIAVVILLKAVTISKDMGIAGAGAVVNAGKGAAKWTGKKATKGIGKGLQAGFRAAGGRRIEAGFARVRKRLASRFGPGVSASEEQKRNEAADAAKKQYGIDENSTKEQLDAIQKSKTASATGKRMATVQGMINGHSDIRNARNQYTALQRNGTARERAQFMDAWKKRDPLAAARELAAERGRGEDPNELAAKMIKENGAEGIDLSQMDGDHAETTALMMSQNLTKGQKDKMTKASRSKYGTSLAAAIKSGKATGKARINAAREVGVETGSFKGTGLSAEEQIDMIKNRMSSKDISSLNMNEVDQGALKEWSRNNLGSISKVADNNPEMAAMMKADATAEMERIETAMEEEKKALAEYEKKVEEASGSTVLDASGRPARREAPPRPESKVSSADRAFLGAARKEFGRPTT